MIKLKYPNLRLNQQPAVEFKKKKKKKTEKQNKTKQRQKQTNKQTNKQKHFTCFTK